ncbi:MAG: DUF1559 domain-containing protein, partial [Pirellulales bacterium]
MSLVDLLVALTIVGLAVALVLPALNAQTEQKRQLSCSNNLKVIGLAIQNFHDIRQEICPSYLTTDLTTFAPTGHAAWPILLMPYLEHGKEYDRFDLAQPVGQDAKTATVDHAAARTTSLATYFCSARRVPPQLTTDKSGTVGDYGNVSYGLAGKGADPSKPQTYNGAMMVCRVFNASDKVNSEAISPFKAATLGPRDFRAMTTFASVLDGLSNTAFFAEKAAHADRLGQADSAGSHQDGTFYYGSGGAKAGQSAFTHPGAMAFWSRRLGAENETTPLLPKEPKSEDPNNRFGSWHPKVTLFSLGDGSVKWVYHTTSNTVLERFGARNDRQ